MSVDDLDIPEVKLFDHMRMKNQLLDSFGKWRMAAYIRRQKQNCFQSYMSNPQFDLTNRMEALYDQQNKFKLMNTVRKLTNEYQFSKEARLVSYLTKHRILCRAFGTWQSKYYDGLVQTTSLVHSELAVSKNHRIPDILREIHDSITYQAELSTESEQKDRELEDINSIIADTQRRLAESQDRMGEALQEYKRISNMKQSVEMDYKDKIAAFKMQINQAQELAAANLETAKNSLKLKQEANDATAESIYESKDQVAAQIADLNNRLNEAQIVAMNLRDELVVSSQEQAAAAAECAELKRAIDQLQADCDHLDTAVSGFEDSSVSAIDQLKAMLEKAHESQDLLKAKSAENATIIAQQADEIEKLSRALALIQRHTKTAEEAFNEEEDLY